MPDLPSPLLAALPLIREHLEVCWPFSREKAKNSNFNGRHREVHGNPHAVSAGYCRHSSLFLQRRLKEMGHPDWKCAGGTARIDGSDEFGGHWWLEKDGTILDLTADQFSGPSIQVVPADHLDYRWDVRVSKQSFISRLSHIVDQWEGQGFGFWDNPARTKPIEQSFHRLNSELRELSVPLSAEDDLRIAPIVPPVTAAEPARAKPAGPDIVYGLCS